MIIIESYDTLSVKKIGESHILLAVKKRHGFTLLEIIVSVILIPLIWLGISSFLSANKSLTDRAKHMVQAILLAQQEIEQYRSSSPRPTSATSRNVTLDTGGTVPGTITVTPTILSSTFNTLTQITATVDWNEPNTGSPQSESLTTIVSDDPAL